MPEVMIKNYSSPKGLWSWITTTDHKRIGIMYSFVGLVGLILGMAGNLSVPRLFDFDSYVSVANSTIFTLYDSVSVFVVLLPLMLGVFSYFSPLMIGATTMLLPRLFVFGWWNYLWGYVFLILSSYGETNVAIYKEVSAVLLSFSLGASSISLLVTIWKGRSDGMTLGKMPVMIWAVMLTCIVWLLIWPAIGLRALTHIGGWEWSQPLLGWSDSGILTMDNMWHGVAHPEIIILLIPSLAIAFTIATDFIKKDLSYVPQLGGYVLLAIFTVVAGMQTLFSVGGGDQRIVLWAAGIIIILGLLAIIGILTIIPRLSLNPAFFFAVFSLITPLVGGISTGRHFPDYFQQGLYDINSYFFYVLFGVIPNALFAAIYYWFPKVTGGCINSKMAVSHMLLHIVGLYLVTIPPLFDPNIKVAGDVVLLIEQMAQNSSLIKAGLILTSLGTFVMFVNILYSLNKGESSSSDSWDGRSLEWNVPSPVPDQNYVVVLNPSFWPLITSLGLVNILAGVLSGQLLLGGIGGGIILLAVFGWSFQPCK